MLRSLKNSEEKIMLKQYDVTFHLRRTVVITVDCGNEDDAEGDAYDELDLQEDEEVVDVEISAGDPSGE
jgi:hypothetical protein